MTDVSEFGIIGGGLAGLCLAIRLSKGGKSVKLFERKSYPSHKVCGEYVSNETLPYLNRLGFDPFDFGAVKIERLLVSNTSGSDLRADLDLGGFGLSRYTFDHELSKIAIVNGAEVFDNCIIQSIEKENDLFILKDSKNQEYRVNQVIGAQGKRSTIDSHLNRSFLKNRSPYAGIKYHIKYKQDNDLIALHNFRNGYCGISRIEDDKYCLCYLVKNSEIKKAGSIAQMEKELLSKNRYLKDIFEHAEFIYNKPLAINEISFEKKSLYDWGIPMIGDAAGMIAPLAGNGMAMAIHSSKLLADSILGQENDYKENWNSNFSNRLFISRSVQRNFGNESMTSFMLSFFNAVEPLRKKLISLTHGKPF